MIQENLSWILSCILFMSLIISNSSERSTCVQRSPCICEYEDGKTLDLTHISPNSFLSAEEENFTFYFHPCNDIKLNFTLPNVTVTDCKEPLSLCLYNKTSKKLLHLGDAKNAKFVQSEMMKPQLVFSTGPEINSTTTIITLSCSDIPNDLLFATQGNNQQNNLFLASPWACIQTHQHSVSTGTMLLVMLLVFATVYLIGGAIVLRTLRGARGREMIPNLDFWMDLPALVRDGIRFIVGGCRTTSNADSYDSI